ncbi:MAG: putative metal-binding motif-containing protein, partial [Myxococcota bacterium]
MNVNKSTCRGAVPGLLALVLLVTVGCEVTFEADRADRFSCQTDADCVDPFICVIGESGSGVCSNEPTNPISNTSSTGPACVDADRDSFGENCSNGTDCDDGDADVYPGAPEFCDGKDNDCDCTRDDNGMPVDCPIGESIDEVTSCTVDEDCPQNDPEASTGMECVEGTCRYVCNLQIGVCLGKTTTCTTVEEDGVVVGEVLSCSVPGPDGLPAYGPDFQSVSESNEPCDGLDNNCNGLVDSSDTCMDLLCDPEEPEPCSLDLGVCKAGIELCVDNMVMDCVDIDTGDPVIERDELNETCNGLDDNCDGVVDNAPGDMLPSTICPDCPFEMVLITNPFTQSRYCIDRYEASRPDATATSAGVDGGIVPRAVSQGGVLPWTDLDISVAQNACRGGDMRNARPTQVDKRLCGLAEISFACGGNDENAYPYGETYDATLCNGQEAGLGELAPTGPTDEEGDSDFAGCTVEHNGQLVYDLSGNAGEL